MKIDSASPGFRPALPEGSISPGIYPYLGATVSEDRLRSIAEAHDGAVVSGMKGAKLARQVPGVLLDPALYNGSGDAASEDMLFEFDDWLKRQQEARTPVILTDTPRIPKKNRAALHEALGRWELLDTPTLVVLPVEPWWLKDGLERLVEEVRLAARPVAIVLLASYNGLDAAGAVAGLLTFIAEVRPVPVTLLRFDISAVGAVAHGACAGFVGWSPTTRHGPLPGPPSGQNPDRLQDRSPSMFVPVLHDYFKASKFPALERFRPANVLRCDDDCCGEHGLSRIAELAETDPIAARKPANQHSITSAELLAQRVLSADEPRDSWWEACKAGAIASVSLSEAGINFPASSWIRQWIEAGSPSHAPETVD